MWYLAEQYQPGTDIDELRRATARLADAAAALTADGVNIRFAGASFVPSDESCFCRFESDSIDAVRIACQRAQFPTTGSFPSTRSKHPAAGLPGNPEVRWGVSSRSCRCRRGHHRLRSGHPAAVRAAVTPRPQVVCRGHVPGHIEPVWSLQCLHARTPPHQVADCC